MEDEDPFLEVDDEVSAARLQLREIDIRRTFDSGECSIDSCLDYISALEDWETELNLVVCLFEDLKLAHSIAKAVGTDAPAIEEVRAAESQAVQDRAVAIGLNEGEDIVMECDTSLEAASESGFVHDWDDVLRPLEASSLSYKSDTTAVDETTSCIFNQQAVLQHLQSLKVECSVCGESVHPHFTVRLACNDIYCKPCLKDFFLRVTRDESLFPPKCHRQPIDISLIQAELSGEELAAYQNAELEYTSIDRLYCSNTECTKFIPMSLRGADSATCIACNSRTCVHCRRPAHLGVCPADKARQSLVDYAREQGYQSCFGCGEMVFRYEGCDHITCRCRSEFCYKCGVKWKECSCGDWEEELLDQRAEQVVDREAPAPLAPAVRRQRVVAMARELQTNHECDHSGRFARLEGRGRRGYVCELCGDRHWKYILSCRRCHLLACEDCRRHRV